MERDPSAHRSLDALLNEQHGGVRGGRETGAVPPQRRKWVRSVALPVGAVLVVGGLLAYTARDALRPAAPVRVLPVVMKQITAEESVDRARHGSARGTAGGGLVVQAPGWIEPDPYAVNATALTNGVLREVLVLEGDSVKKGEIVARLIDDDAKLMLKRAEAQVMMRTAQLAAAMAARDAAQADWDNPIERRRAVDTVAAMLAEREAELRRHPSLVAVHDAVLAKLEAELSRQEQALTSGAANELEVIRRASERDAQRATLAAERKRGDVLRAQIDLQRAEFHAAQENLRLRIQERRALDTAVAEVRGAEAALLEARAMLEEATLRLDRTAVRAPISGAVLSREKEPGDKVMLEGDMRSSATIVRLYDPSRLQVRVDIPLADAGGVGVGQHAKVVVDVLPDREFDGVVTRITHEADLQKNTLQVKVSIQNPSYHLKPEMLARVKINAESVDHGTAAPALWDSHISAGRILFAPESGVVRRSGEEASAWVVVDRRDQRGTLRLRPISLGGLSDGAWVEVREGLSPGDLVAVSDADRIGDGKRVRIVGGGSMADSNTRGGS